VPKIPPGIFDSAPKDFDSWRFPGKSNNREQRQIRNLYNLSASLQLVSLIPPMSLNFMPLLADAHILLVDNQPDELQLLIEALRKTRCRLSVAFDGAQAYDRAQAIKPDLIVMDVRMPRMDGFASCRLLAANKATCDIPIIFLSAATELDERLTGFGSGGVDYVTKPFEPAEVIARIQVHLKKTTRRQQDDLPGLDHTVTDPLVRAAIQHLSAHLHQPPRLEELARLLGTHERRLSRVFRETFGQSVLEFLRDQRLQLSQRLLAQTALSITAIAEEAGFSSAANFATAFRERYGQPPSAWRRDHATLVNDESGE
jgi:DNA-binding response OmpR family regulator